MEDDTGVKSSIVIGLRENRTKEVLMARGCFDDTKRGVLVKNLAAKEPSAHGLDAYYKQYYPCLICCRSYNQVERSRETSHRHKPPIVGIYALSLSGPSFSCEMHACPRRPFLRNRCIFLIMKLLASCLSGSKYGYTEAMGTRSL
ncbi:PREDICTED: uncharacterized protein LOC105130887 isoform X2 [Populus euphratica]|uniref:Uncharacterized protein LOC105130887 isoform X2 n=1 Tax=Populus euphratica TaxID=75702 RepID=A0AAJ6XV24_POPEU|nr:PREDICTED: uncharacterized protein LOC105130887 isoform X2 [Populus euphratica]